MLYHPKAKLTCINIPSSSSHSIIRGISLGEVDVVFVVSAMSCDRSMLFLSSGNIPVTLKPERTVCPLTVLSASLMTAVKLYVTTDQPCISVADPGFGGRG